MKFKQGAVIRKYEVKGRKVVFRWPRMSDAAALARYRNRLAAERPPMILATKPDMTVQKEKKYLQRKFKAIKEGTIACPVVEVDGKAAALLHANIVHPDSPITKHVAEIGVGLDRDFRGLGIGHLIMEMLEYVSRKYLKAEVIQLHTIGYNKKAQSLYRNHGFRETGRIPKAIKYKGKYYDIILMCKVLRK